MCRALLLYFMIFLVFYSAFPQKFPLKFQIKSIAICTLYVGTLLFTKAKEMFNFINVNIDGTKVKRYNKKNVLGGIIWYLTNRYGSLCSREI